MTTSQLSPDVIAAYYRALYTFSHPGGDITMRVDQACPELIGLYWKYGLASLTFITACNPLGDIVSDEENTVATSALNAELCVSGVPVFSGEGKDPTGPWREASFAVLGMGLTDSRHLGHKWRQNAIVWAQADAVLRLELLR